MQKISVNVKPAPYQVLLQRQLVRNLGPHLLEALGQKPSHVFVVTVSPVRKEWGKALGAALDSARLKYDVLEMPDGERHKTLSTVEDLAEKMVKQGADRNALVVAFGGGVVGDVAGFLAAVYMRGLRVVQVPTTFLAQVDAAIGGKTGVNLKSGKNLVGSFHQPRAVFVDPEVLATLPEREYRAGLYEALKCGVIRNPRIFDFMEQNRERVLHRDLDALEWLLVESIRVKAEVVSLDEREDDLRRILNFGHTIGHALEAETSYKHFLHGEAVAWGMIAAVMIAVALKGSSEHHKAKVEDSRRIISSILAYAPLPRVDVRPKNILKRLRNDKKTLDGSTHFILPIELGRVEIVKDVSEKAILHAVEELRALSRV